jgi:hypothetical protein
MPILNEYELMLIFKLMIPLMAAYAILIMGIKNRGF